MFLELFNGSIFKVESLQTKISEVCSIDINDSKDEIQKALRRASTKEEDYDNIVIIQNGKPKGFVSREELSRSSGNLNEITIKKVKNYNFKVNDSLNKVIKKIKEDYEITDEINLYFITNNETVTGIITYADLNRKSVYIYNYILYSFVEQWLRKQISKEYKNKNRRISDKWMMALNEGQKMELMKRSKKQGESTISVCDLFHLVQVFKKDPKFTTLREETTDKLTVKTLEDLVSMRPKIAHPTKLLVPKDKIKDRLTRLMRISDLVEMFIPYEDFNEKNGGWPSY